MATRITKETLLDRAIPEPNSGCWLWEGYAKKVTETYLQPRVMYKNKAMSVSRLLWILFNGEIPKGKSVCHTCDVSLCINPKHLYLGTHTENMLDLAKRGRGRTANQIMGPSDVVMARELRLKGNKVKDIAEKFGVSPKGMSRILTGKRWAFLSVGGQIG
jgi:hypothetical protein